MYYIFPFYQMGNEKTSCYLIGTLYNSEQTEMEDFIFNEGLVLDEKEIKPPFTIIMDEKESYYKGREIHDRMACGVTNINDLLLVSPKVQAFFQELKVENIQFFDVDIKASDFELKDYKVANITEMFDCLDYEKSDILYYTSSPNKINKIYEIVLDESKIPTNKSIFVLNAKGRKYTIIHESLKNKMEASDLTGFYFQDLEFEYTTDPDE